jgi:hypothetical protein
VLVGAASPAAGRADAGSPPLAAASPFAEQDGTPTTGSGSDRSGAAAGSGDRSAPGRLGRAAAALRRSPLWVDPEVDWMFDAKTRRSVERALGAARIRVFVAALPVLTEDESGGDLERIVQTLQRQVGEDGLYVAVDQDGRMDLASVGVPLDLGIPFSILFPPRDDRPYDVQSRDPAPPSWTTVPGRIDDILDAVAKAGPGTPNGVIDDVDPLERLSGSYRADRVREDTIASASVGAVLGLTLSLTFLGIRAGVRSARSSGGGRPGGGRGGSPGARQGGGGRRRRRGKGRRA